MAITFRCIEKKYSEKTIFFFVLRRVFITNYEISKQFLINKLERSRNYEEIFERLTSQIVRSTKLIDY